MTPSHNSSPSIDLLLRYVAHEATEPERADIAQWLAADPSRHDTVHALRQIEYPVIACDVDRAWHSVVTSIDQRPAHAGAPVAATRRYWQWGQGIAALFVAVIGAFVIWGIGRPSRDSDTTMQEYRTAAGERSVVRLSGGSRMTIGPATTVRVERDIATVNGEAYFQVAPNSKRTIVVRLPNTEVRVLGTKFSVKQYPGDSYSDVIVEEGKVSLQRRAARATQTPVVLTAGMSGRVTDSTVMVDREVDAESRIGWVRGRLVFDNAPLRDVMPELARVYAADIAVHDSVLANMPLTMTVAFERQSLAEVLVYIERVTTSHYVRTGRTLVLVPGARSARGPRISDILTQEKRYGR